MVTGQWLAPVVLFCIFLLQSWRAWNKRKLTSKAETFSQRRVRVPPMVPCPEVEAKTQSKRLNKLHSDKEQPVKALPVNAFEYRVRVLAKSEPRGKQLLADRQAVRRAILVSAMIGPPRALKPYEWPESIVECES